MFIKKFLYINIIIASSFINYLSCNSNPLAPEFYDDGSFYYYFDEKIKIYPSNSVMSVKFKDDLSPIEVNKILKDYHLEFYSELYSKEMNINSLINNNENIVVKLNDRRNTANNFITRYPKVNFSASRFGNIPEVKYCLPSYSTDGSDKDSKRIFITDDLRFKFLADSNHVEDILQRYNLNLIPREYLGENVYLCEVTEYSPKDPLNTANELQEESNILWATPDFYFFFRP